VKGTRVPVHRIWNWHRKGVLVETLVKRYPTLGWAKILDALSYAYDNQELVEKISAEEQAMLNAEPSFPLPEQKEFPWKK
jgi:Protein of unknown function (DUF433)